MTFSLASINLQPLVDLLSKAGEESSEFKVARNAGRMALVLFFVGLFALLCATATNVFGSNSRVGIIAGTISTVIGVLSSALASMGYSSARADTKTAAGSLASDLVAVAAAPAPALTPAPKV